MVPILKSPVSHWAAPGKIDLDLKLNIQILKIPSSSQITTETHQNPKLEKQDMEIILNFEDVHVLV